MKTLLKTFLFFFLLNQIQYSQWVQVGPSGLAIYSLLVNGSNVFAGTDFTGLYKSTDKGQTWLTTSLNSGTIRALAVIDSNIFAGSYDGLYKSTDEGQTWTTSLLGNIRVSSLVVNGSDIFAGTGSGIYRSSDSGQFWVQTALYNFEVYSIALSGTYIFAGTGSGLFRSSDYGQTWSEPSLYNIGVQSITANGSNVIAGTWEEGLFCSSNNGETWAYTPDLSTVTSMLFVNSIVFAGSNGVYYSTSNGHSWSNISEGLPVGYIVMSLALSEEYIYAGLILDFSIWRRPLSDIITNTSDENDYISTEYILFQSYPNPFNPSTTIKYSIPTSGFVTLKIYDVLGNEVATLVNAEKLAGSYEVDFNAAQLSSGIYFYKLQTGNFVATKKMILMK